MIEILIYGADGAGKETAAYAMKKNAEAAGYTTLLSNRDAGLFGTPLKPIQDYHRKNNPDISIITIYEEGSNLRIEFSPWHIPFRILNALFS